MTANPNILARSTGGAPAARGTGVPPMRIRSGFSMVELLIAIGIMGIGMVMVSALFPTAIKENEFSAANNVGSIICENGLAVAQARLTSTSTIPGNALSNISGQLGAADLVTPAGSGSGFLLLGRTNAANDWTLVAVSYSKRDPAKQVRLTSAQFDIGSPKNHLTLSSTSNNVMPDGIIGSPVVRQDGAYVGRVIGKNGNDLTLDSWPDPAAGQPAAGTTYWFIQEGTGNSGAFVATPVSPGLYAMSTRTAPGR